MCMIFIPHSLYPSSLVDNVLSLVIPAYNEAERLPIMLDATLDYLNTYRTDITYLYNDVCGHATKPIQCELVIVNDGSTDDTERIIQKYATKYIKNGDIVKLVSMHKNCGKGGAVKTGMFKVQVSSVSWSMPMVLQILVMDCQKY